MRVFQKGLGAAILLDATVVRMMLVPAAMKLLEDLELVPSSMAGMDTGPARRRDH